jgi:hypothetical protein
LEFSSDGQGPLRERLERDYVASLKSRDSARVSVLRLLKAAMQNAEKVKGSPLSQSEMTDVIAREVKMRRESCIEFERGGRSDLATAETHALEILAEYQPSQLSEDDIRELVEQAVSGLDPEARSNPRSALGVVMRAVMPDVKGRADGNMVSEIVRAVLGETAG